MEIHKGLTVEKVGVPNAAQLASINQLAKAEMKAEDVYVFSLRLCDDRIDRDGERFDTAALPILAGMFVGKTGVCDHNWSSGSQVARIFQTDVVREEDCSYLKAWAYIRRGEKTEELIADIEAGIKKEVSVGVAMGKCVCSICGSEMGACGHRKGEMYDGQTCHGILRDPVDAYEFSFVAVPAQKDAGVLKAMGGGTDLRLLAEKYGAQQQYRELYKLAELGKTYRKELENRVVRLVLMLGLDVEEPIMRSIAQKAAAEELEVLEKALKPHAEKQFAPVSQLLGRKSGENTLESDYLI